MALFQKKGNNNFITLTICYTFKIHCYTCCNMPTHITIYRKTDILAIPNPTFQYKGVSIGFPRQLIVTSYLCASTTFTSSLLKNTGSTGMKIYNHFLRLGDI